MNDDLDTLLSEIKTQALTLDNYGMLHLTLKKHGGFIKNADVMKITSYKFSRSQPNVTAATTVMQLMKAIQQAQETGQLSFNITFVEGNAEQMQVQDFKKL